MSKQPRDDAGQSIPILGYKPQKGMIIPFTDSANTSPKISSDVLVLSLYSTTDCFVEFGDANVIANTSNSHFIPASMPQDVSLLVYDTHMEYVSVIGSEAGVLYISERV